ncbi:MAG: zinc metallopeptidase [Thermotogaceae bacterium]|nr:zinc metallopeptidase [Thermotogaceae bacterium]
MFWFWDPTFIILIPAFILSLWAQIHVHSTFSKYSNVKSSLGITGAEMAKRLLESAGIYDVRVEMVSGWLSDHYDPRAKVVRLSQATYNSSSVAALGVVAHEVGHAIQHKEKYAPLVFRDLAVPFAIVGSNFAWIIFILGIFMSAPVLLNAGIILFSFAVLFSLITLPVEFDASARAIKKLRFMMPESEVEGVKKVLTAAALTYVASAAVAILQLLRMLLIAGVFGDRE